MLTRDKLEYQKRLRFLREAKAKTASEKLKLATRAEESDLTKRMVTLGDKENRVPARGETPKSYNEVPKTRETSRVKEPVEAGDKGDNVLDIDLSDLDYARISEQKRFYVKRVGSKENEPYSGEEMDVLDIEPQFYSDEEEAGTVADMLIDLDPHNMEDFYVANLEDEPLDSDEDEEFSRSLKEATPPQEDADQSLARMKKRKKATRTKSMKRKSHAKLNETNLEALLRECGCEMESPFDAPEDEPQGYMLVQNLEKLAKKAGELTGVAKYTDDAEPWVESKVNSAAEHIDAIYDYIKYGRNKKSDMNGGEDLHPPHHDEMMNEKKNLKINNLISEQTVRPSDEIVDPWAGETPRPSATVVDPWASSTSAPTRRSGGRRAAVTEASQAINLIFDPNTPRSFINHLTRMLRGIQQNNATIADYELRANRTSVSFVLNRYIPLVRRERTDLSAVLDELVNQINTFNRPELPQSLAQITNRQQAIRKITALIEWLNGNRNRVVAPAPTTTPTPETTPAPTPVPETNPEEEAAYNNAMRRLTEAQQAISQYIDSIVQGEVDLSDARNRPAYFERLNQLVSAYNDAMRELQTFNASRGTEVLDRSVENYIRRIDNIINQLNSNPDAVRMYFENSFPLQKSLKRFVESVPSSKSLLETNIIFEQEEPPSDTETFISSALGATLGAAIIRRMYTNYGPQAAQQILRLGDAVRSIAPRALEAIRNLAATNPSAAATALAEEATIVEAGLAGEMAALAGEATLVTTTGIPLAGELAAGEFTAAELAAMPTVVAPAPVAPAAATPWLPALGAGIAGYGLGTLGVGTYGAITGRGTDTAEVYGFPVGLSVRPDRSVNPNNVRFAATAATRILQNQKSALQSIRNALRTGGSARISGIANPYSRSLSDIANEIDPAWGLPRD